MSQEASEEESLLDLERQRDAYRSALHSVVLLGLELVKDPSPENLRLFEIALNAFPEEFRSPPDSRDVVTFSPEASPEAEGSKIVKPQALLRKAIRKVAGT